MKATLCLILLTSLLLTGCGAAAPEATTILEQTTVPTLAETTAPTLSPEELFLQSLPEKLRQACTLGFITPELLEDPDRPCTKSEAIAVLQQAISAKYGRESWMYAHALSEEEGPQEATRGWTATMLYVGEAETLVELESEDYAKNLKQLTYTKGGIKHQIADTLMMNQGFVYMPNASRSGTYDNYTLRDATVAAYSAYGSYGGAVRQIADRKDFPGDDAILSYAITRYDRTTGEKLLPWDAEQNFRPDEVLTVRQMAELSLRYYNALIKRQILPYDEIPTYDTSILPPELLTRESQLPEPSCQNLPVQWHGVRVKDLTNTGEQLDLQIYEWELDAIQQAGFNYVQVVFDFRNLQGEGSPSGTLDEAMLKELDQVLAWCIEKDLHMNLACNGACDWPASSFTALFNSESNRKAFVDQWEVLARRYADIPNTFLSFTLFHQPYDLQEKAYNTFFTPVVEKIRQYSPDRCLIAEIYQNATGESMAALGVALSSPCEWPDAFWMDYKGYRSSLSVLPKATWPVEKGGQLLDGESAMTNRLRGYTPPDTIAATAKAYGVGYMISSWGPQIHYSKISLPDRYPDEVMSAYLTDMTQVMAHRGYGWCYTTWHSTMGIACTFPLVQTTTYTQFGDHPLYIDEEMTGWFQTINGIS